MKAADFIRLTGADFFTGVPDSLLKPLCNTLMATYVTDPLHHIIAANEGNAAALAAGYHLATGKVACVYMQNSGEGNIVNPAASLLDDAVYGIPVLFVVGWRGEPGVHDEPQHVKQGQITLRLLEDMDIEPFVLEKDTSVEALEAVLQRFRSERFACGKSAAIVVRKGALTDGAKVSFTNDHPLTRERIIEAVTAVSGDDPIVSTTGKASRELFELREAAGKGHGLDFLTVGSMGHASSIAMGVALRKPGSRVWCIDGDGAALMHMGAMAVIGQTAPANLIHIVINNAAHETVGGLPTAAGGVDLCAVARACGYGAVYSAEDLPALENALAQAAQSSVLTLIEVKSAIGARDDLGRPTTTARENKEAFMACLKTKD